VDTRSRPAVGASCPGSDPAALRVITVVVLAGLVVSGIVVISRHGPTGFGRAGGPQAMAPPSAPAGLPRAPAATAPTLKLLSQAARACQTTTYQGVEVFGAGQDTSVVNVWHVPGGITLARAVSAAPPWSGVAPHIVTPGSYLGDQALVGSVMLGMSPRLVALLRNNYRLTAVGWGQVAGRAAREVTVIRPDGKLAAEFWLDKITTLPLRRETFDGRGHIVSDVTFAQLTVGSAAMARPAATAPRRWVAARPARLRAEGWPLPGPLPDGLALLGAREDDTATGRVVDLDYSDGLSLVSVFLQRGHLKSQLIGWSRMALGGSPVYADEADGQSFVWSAHGYVYTLVAAAPAQTVAQVVAALPHDGSPGLLARMRQGLHRLMSWLTP
jgi:sigma-E factor negative regulatory protein RseB